MPEQSQDGLLLLDQIRSQAPATAQQHDACRQIMAEIVKMRGEWLEMKQRFAAELEKEPLGAKADDPPGEEAAKGGAA